MLRITQDSHTKRKYKYIERFLYDSLKEHKDLLPKNLTVNIYNSIRYFNTTGIASYQNPEAYIPQRVELDLNLEEILWLYKNPDKVGRDIPYYQNKIKGFRNYLLFVLYHEIGHYNKGHLSYRPPDFTSRERKARELKADKFSYWLLKRRQNL